MNQLLRDMLVHTFRILCVVLFVPVLLPAQTPEFGKQWDRRFGGSEDDVIGHFEMTADSGFIIGGTTFSGVSGDLSEPNLDTSLATSDFWLVKADPSGTILWEKRYGGTLAEILDKTIISSDGGLISGGQSFSDDNGDKTQPNWDTTLLSNDYWIIKTDMQGVKTWDKRFGGVTYEIFGDLAEDFSGNIIISGSSFSEISGDKTEPSRGGWDFWLIYTDPSGNKIWDRRFGGVGDDFATTVVVTPDSCFVIGGYSASPAGGDKSQTGVGGLDYWIVKVDPSGNKLWDKTFSGQSNDWLFALEVAHDNGLLLGGQSYSPVSGDKSEPNHGPAADTDRWIIKTDASGNKQWDRSIGGTETEDVSRMVAVPDGGFIISGESYSDTTGDKTEPNLGPEQTWVIKVDSSGSVLWDKTLFTYGHDESGIAIPYGDHCFVSINFTQADTGGYKSEMGWGASDFWMIKMCEIDPLSVFEIQTSSAITVYPNPFTEAIEIVGVPEGKTATIIFRDGAGRKIKAQELPAVHNNQLLINTRELQPGFYILSVYTEGDSYSLPVIRGY